VPFREGCIVGRPDRCSGEYGWNQRHIPIPFRIFMRMLSSSSLSLAPNKERRIPLHVFSQGHPAAEVREATYHQNDMCDR